MAPRQEYQSRYSVPFLDVWKIRTELFFVDEQFQLTSLSSSSVTRCSTESQFPGFFCLKRRIVGYQGLSSRSNKQRQSGAYGSKVHTDLPIASARGPNCARQQERLRLLWCINWSALCLLYSDSHGFGNVSHCLPSVLGLTSTTDWNK